MRISPIYSCNFSKTNFSSSLKQKQELEKGQFMYLGDVFNSGFTKYARDDINWQNFGKYLKNKYPDISKVDINLFACSTGEEAYTMAILLKHLYKDNPFTINAMDIDKCAIDGCIYNQLHNTQVIDFEDIENINKRIGLSKEELESFFREMNPNFYNIQKIKIISPDISRKVNFKKANILTSLDILDVSKPNIIMARNMWPYVNSKEYYNFADKLYKKLPSNSTVIIGGYDITGYHGLISSSLFPVALHKSGFKRLCVDDYYGIDTITKYFIYEK